MQEMSSLIRSISPSAVLVQGDTATTFFSALAAFNLRSPVVHLEAGLRTNRLNSPFPEEGYRQMVSRISSYHFSPTDGAKQNLVAEGIDSDRIFVTGNSAVDAVNWVKSYFKANPVEHSRIQNLLHDEIGLTRSRPFVLVTDHRRENQGENMPKILRALDSLSRKMPDFDFLWILHPNPALQSLVRDLLPKGNSVKVARPVTYLEMSLLLQTCQFVMTDSGGLQEEAPSYGKYSMVLRNSTERPEAIHEGLSWLAGADKTRIEKTAMMIAQKVSAGKDSKIIFPPNPFGDGKTGLRVAHWLTKAIRSGITVV
jgi:UDP-N-acetylglucosamine 2-epimerase (non-hydrolysing)